MADSLRPPGAPTAFRYPDVGPRRARLRSAIRRLTGVDPFPSDGVARAFIDGLTEGDPVAERFVAQTYHGEMGARRARDLVERAQRDGIDSVRDAPESMRALFEEFEKLPDWVQPDLVEQGAAVWRRWAYALGALGNAGTTDTYTEGWLAVPLSLSGGYAGRRALHRYLETSRWWIEVCRPGAILTPGSPGRSISLHVRIMHVSVRERVRQHPEWDEQRWGLPISQSAMLLTLLGGSVAPALGLFLLGHVTSPAEMRAVLHFNRYCGHLVGVRCEGYFPETLADAWRILLMADSARSHDSGSDGAELVESFVPAFAPPRRTAGSVGCGPNTTTGCRRATSGCTCCRGIAAATGCRRRCPESRCWRCGFRWSPCWRSAGGCRRGWTGAGSGRTSSAGSAGCAGSRPGRRPSSRRQRHCDADSVADVTRPPTS